MILPTWVRQLATPLTLPLILYTLLSSAGLWLAVYAGLMGLPLGLGLLFSLASYSLVLMESIAHGKPAPLMSIDMFNPAHHPRALIGLSLVIGAISLLAWAQSLASPTLLVLTGGAVITLLPLMLALLALDDSAVSALSPARWLHTLAGLHGHYLAWLATLALSVSALTVLANQLGFFLCLLLGILLTLMVATSLGGLLYQCRDGIGLEAWVTPERGHLLALQEENRARENLIHELYGSLRAKNIESAWNSALQWLTQRGLKPQDMVWLRSRVQDWKDPRLSERLTAELIAYYLRVGNTDAALADVESWLDTGRRYHATHARDLGRLIGLSRLDGRHALANRLLDECTQPHAEHEEIKNLLKHRTSQT